MENIENNYDIDNVIAPHYLESQDPCPSCGANLVHLKNRTVCSGCSYEFELSETVCATNAEITKTVEDNLSIEKNEEHILKFLSKIYQDLNNMPYMDYMISEGSAAANEFIRICDLIVSQKQSLNQISLSSSQSLQLIHQSVKKIFAMKSYSIFETGSTKLINVCFSAQKALPCNPIEDCDVDIFNDK